MLYMMDNRDAIKIELGSAVGSKLAKAAGAKWNAMPELEKASYEERAAAEKEAYNQAMVEFKAGGGVPAKRRSAKRRSAKDKELPELPPAKKCKSTAYPRGQKLSNANHAIMNNMLRAWMFVVNCLPCASVSFSRKC